MAQHLATPDRPVLYCESSQFDNPGRRAVAAAATAASCVIMADIKLLRCGVGENRQALDVARMIKQAG